MTQQLTSVQEVESKIEDLSKSILLRPIKLANDSETVGAIVSLEGTKILGTVVDPEFQQHGGYISFHEYVVYDNLNRPINGIEVPPMPVTYEMAKTVAVLHPIAVRANTVARVLEAVKKNEQTTIVLANTVKKYLQELSRTIFGKNGAYNRYILGPRLKNSFRAVIIPGMYDQDILGESYQWVGIPRRIMSQLSIAIGQIVIIGRDPTIWFGSLEVLRAYPVEHDAIEIHPLMLPQLGGDHDGDQVWGYFPDNDTYLQNHVGTFIEKYSSWGKNFNDNTEITTVDWQNFKEDQQKRIKTTGLSVSPLDILNKEGDLLRILDYSGKGPRSRGKSHIDELYQTAYQVSIKEWQDMSEMINQAQLAMKIYMGPVGLLAMRLMVISHMDPKLTEAAHLLSERISQSLLDSKHLTYSELKDYKPGKIFEILNLSNSYITNASQMFQALKDLVKCDERSLPILECIIADGRGLSMMSQQDFPLFEGTTFTASSTPGGYVPECIIDNDTKDLGVEGIFGYAFYEALNIEKNDG
jgi:hypothetical protein